MTRPPVTYPVSLADLVDIADAASELEGMKGFYIDRPDEQKLITVRAERLHEIVHRAAAHDQYLIYGNDEVDAA